MSQVKLLKIFMASPSDVAKERDYVIKVIEEINRTIAPGKGVRLEVVRSEGNAFPSYNLEGGQAVLNEQIGKMEEYALFVGIMWNRVGTPTPRADSGTIEEFELAVEALDSKGQPHIWFYFRETLAKFDKLDDSEQRQKVLKFKQEIQLKALTQCYKNPSNFRDQFRSHIALWLNKCESKTPQHEWNQESLSNILDRIISTLKEAIQLFTMRIKPNSIETTQTYEKVHQMESLIYKLMELIDNEQLSNSQTNSLLMRVMLEDPNEGILTHIQCIGTDLLAVVGNTSDAQTIQLIRSKFKQIEYKLNQLKKSTINTHNFTDINIL